MPNINLLPKDFAPDSALLTSSNLIRKLILVGVVSLILFVVGMFIYNFTLTSRIRTSLVNQENYKKEILALESVEQMLVLTKDRATKLGAIIGNGEFGTEILNLRSLLARITIENVIEISLSTDKTEVTLIARDSLKLVEMMASLISLDNYENIDLISFNFNTNSGFFINLAFSN